MADDNNKNGFGDEGGEDQEDGLGNLPPLSDFESSEGGADLDSNLPPLSGLDSDSEGTESVGGLPPISDIPVETPVPTGGNVKPAPPGFEDTSAFDTPDTEGGMETPDTPEPTGFQDLSADSDFTPETPEVAPPGPDSDLETPMFDSAFGGPDSEFGGVDTSAPTQAMETPMFGDANGGPAGPQVEQPAFDADAFGAGQPDEAFSFEPEGTPMPDFSPDTAAPTAPTPPPATPQMTPPEAAPVARAPKGGGGGLVKLLIAAVLALVVGAAVGLFMGPKMSFIPNESRDKLATAEQEIQTQKTKIADLQKTVDKFADVDEQEVVSLEEIQKRTDELNNLKKEVETATGQRDGLKKEVAAIEGDIEAKSEQFVRAQQEYEDLLGQTSIVRARQEGLTAEVDRLQGLVGQLEDANARRAATRDTLEHNVERLQVIVREGCPLVPEKFSHAARRDAVDSLKARVSQAKWVSPELLDEYTRLYLQELEIAGTREYFYARIPVENRFGTKTLQWAECLMNGNWSVYYRTLDGKHIGIYANATPGGPAMYEFQDLLPAVVQKQIEEEIVVSRPDDFESKIAVLAEKELSAKETTKWQENFESLL